MLAHLTALVAGARNASLRPASLRLARAVVLVSCLGAATWSHPAKAYVLPADFLCRLLADSRKASLRDVTLVMQATLAERTEPLEERLYIKRPERMRLWQALSPPRVSVSNEGLAASGGEAELKDDGVNPNPWPALWMARGKDLDEMSARMLEAIEAAGIDTNVVSLSRYAGGVAYVVGAKPWQGTKPQLWLDKVSFLPVRILWPVPGFADNGKALLPAAKGTTTAGDGNGSVDGAGMHELRLLNYVAGIPRKFEEWENGRLLRSSEVTRVTVNQNLPETLFALPASAR